MLGTMTWVLRPPAVAGFWLAEVPEQSIFSAPSDLKLTVFEECSLFGSERGNWNPGDCDLSEVWTTKAREHTNMHPPHGENLKKFRVLGSSRASF